MLHPHQLHKEAKIKGSAHWTIRLSSFSPPLWQASWTSRCSIEADTASCTLTTTAHNGTQRLWIVDTLSLCQTQRTSPGCLDLIGAATNRPVDTLSGFAHSAHSRLWLLRKGAVLSVEYFYIRNESCSLFWTPYIEFFEVGCNALKTPFWYHRILICVFMALGWITQMERYMMIKIESCQLESSS